MYEKKPRCYQPASPASLVRKGRLGSVNDVFFSQEKAEERYPDMVVFEVSSEIAFPNFVDLDLSQLLTWAEEMMQDEGNTTVCLQGKLHVVQKSGSGIIVDIYNCRMPSDASYQTFETTITNDGEDNEGMAVA